MRVIIVVAVVVFLVDLGAVVGMHTKKHSASPTTTVPTTSTAPPTSAPATSTTASSVPLTTPLTVPETVPVTSPVSTPGTGTPATSVEVTSPSVSSPSVTSPPVTSPPITAPATTTTTVPVTTRPPAGSYSYSTAGSATAQGQTYQLGRTSPIVVSGAACTLNAGLSGEQFVWDSLNSPPNTGSVTTEECLAPGGVYLTSEVFAGNIYLPQSIMCSNTYPVFLPISGSATGQTGVCTSSDGASTADVTVTLVGRGDTTLTDGQVVPTTEDTVVIRFVSGSETGTITTTYHLAGDGVVASENGGANLTAPNGAGQPQTYSYDYGITLVSLTPAG